jgi:hypothetical protein
VCFPEAKLEVHIHDLPEHVGQLGAAMVVCRDDKHIQVFVSSAGPALSNCTWTVAPALGSGWIRMMARINQLSRDGLMRAMVPLDFFRRRLAPLQARIRPV